MDNKPLFSILINNYNYGKFLRRAIESALSQTYRYVEVIVVDDGSTDNSRDIIASYGCRVIPVLKENAGQPSAMNSGFEISKGHIIALLDSDDWFEPSKAEEVVEAFSQNPEASWCFHPLKLVVQGADVPIIASRTFPDLDEDFSTKCDFRKKLKKGQIGFYAPATSGLCFTRRVLDEIFPLPEILGNSVDRYLAYAAMSMEEGYFLNRELTSQLIHEKNHITLQENDVANQHRARHTIVSAFYLRSHFPEIELLCHRVFARGLALSWQYGLDTTDGDTFLEKYLSSVTFTEKMAIWAMALYQRRPWKVQKTYKSYSKSSSA